MLSKGPWGQVIFVEMDPFSFDNICSRDRGRQQTALITGGYREVLWLMIKLIVCQSAPDKLNCPQLCIPGCPMVLRSWKKMSQWFRLENVTSGITAGSESNSQQFAGSLGSYSLTAFSYQNIFYFEVQSLFLTLETAVDQNNLTLWSIQ